MPRVEAVVQVGDGPVDVVNIGRPAALVDFGDRFEKSGPDEYNELAWLAWRAIAWRKGDPLDGAEADELRRDWLETLDELTLDPEKVAAAKRAKVGELEPHERLAALEPAELVELARKPATPGDLLGPTALDELLEAADRSLAELKRRTAETARRAEESAADPEREPGPTRSPTSEPARSAPATIGGVA